MTIPAEQKTMFAGAPRAAQPSRAKGLVTRPQSRHRFAKTEMCDSFTSKRLATISGFDPMTLDAPPSELRWDGYPDTRISTIWEPANFKEGALREAVERGSVQQFSNRGWRTLMRSNGGGGTVDRLQVRNGMDMSVMNCVLPTVDRRVYEIDEPVTVLYASLACDLTYFRDGLPPVTLSGPEFTLVNIPKGLPLTIEIKAGVRQQRIFGLFRHSAIAEVLGLQVERLPEVLREAETGAGSFGRLASVPLDHHVASLVADTIDAPLQGEMRALQYEGRLIELVAYAIDAVARSPAVCVSSRSGRDRELAQKALTRLSRTYVSPPALDELARELGTNSNKLRAVFKAEFGQTMSEYCLDRRIREAQQLLLEARLTISQVAERVGYEYSSGFTAAFARHVGMTPREYRRQRPPISVPLTRGLQD